MGVTPTEETSLYKKILVALDSSDHANHGVNAAVALADLTEDARVTGVHVYAAKMHDVRFRQMEGGLPERYREEQELERQRDVHDDLITRGLSVITDSYLDQAQDRCREADVPFTRCSLEGKNYRALVNETNSGKYDLLIMGALGVGAIAGNRLGTVCERVTRRAAIDTLVIKEPQRHLAEGPIVVAVDGSARAYGGLVTALSLAQQWDVAVNVVAAFDPYFHYVAFNRIAGVLSEEASKVFRFKEQEKLHEEIIDSGLAKIYEGHLAVAQDIATEYGIKVDAVLLDGKPHDAIEKYVSKKKPSLLVIGKLGIHADSELDIGGNAEKLLRDVDCAVLLSQREHRPRMDVVAGVTTSWTKEAEQRIARVPSFVRNMARVAILRYAQERGHTVITERIVEEATAELMPIHMSPESEEKGTPAPTIRWSEEAQNLLDTVDDASVRGNLKMRAEKKARQAGSDIVKRRDIETFLESTEFLLAEDTERETQSDLHWTTAALARLMRVPEGFMRDASRERIENYARGQGATEIDQQVAEQGLALARKAMEETMKRGEELDTDASTKSKCPFASTSGMTSAESHSRDEATWANDAQARLQNIPHDFCRDMTRRAAEAIAGQNGVTEIDSAFIEQVMKTIESAAQDTKETLPWDPDAHARIAKTPDMVRGMLVKEIEGWARRHDMNRVDQAAVNAVKDEWKSRGVFHLDPNDPRSQAGD